MQVPRFTRGSGARERQVMCSAFACPVLCELEAGIQQTPNIPKNRQPHRHTIGMRRLTADTASTLLDRIGNVTEQSRPLWGKFTPSGMIAHLRLALRVSTGDIAVTDNSTWAMRRMISVMLTIGVMPVPRGRIQTLPMFLDDTADAVDAERQQFASALDAFTAALAADPRRVQLHPRFGSLTMAAWSKMHWSHFNHHLVQFGV